MGRLAAGRMLKRTGQGSQRCEPDRCRIAAGYGPDSLLAAFAAAAAHGARQSRHAMRRRRLPSHLFAMDTSALFTDLHAGRLETADGAWQFGRKGVRPPLDRWIAKLWELDGSCPPAR